MNKFHYLIFSVLIIVSGCTSTTKQSISSPDGKVNLDLNLNASGELYYSVSYKDKKYISLISPSALGFEIKNQEKLQAGLIITEIKTTENNETWNQPWGQFKTVKNHYRQLVCEAEEKTNLKRRIRVIFRVFNDGIAFRYELPIQKSLTKYAITKELSGFALSPDNDTWWAMADYNTQEQLFQKTKQKEAHWVNTPITMKTKEGIYMSIHEAALINYPAMTLKQDSSGIAVYHTDLVPWADGECVKVNDSLQTPWRVITISDHPGGLIESNILLNLNAPSKIENSSWIKPLKYIGIWWGMHLGTHTWNEGARHMANTENALRYIDFAKKHHIDGVVIEGWNKGWDKWGKDSAFDQVTSASDFNLKQVAEYARQNGVTLIGHHETGGDIPCYEQTMEKAFALCKQYGIHAVKTGYAGGIRPAGEHHFGQYMVNHYQKAIETAARYDLMMDVHETVKPTGLCRTWPNLMTGEGVRGMEWEAWSDGNKPSHTALLPFTRGLAGPMDYTPGIFDLLYKNRKTYVKWNGQEKQGMQVRVHSTLAHQLGLFVVLYSPMQMAADLIENYEGHPAFQFIEQTSVNYDETKVLDAAIGEYIVTARRTGNNWVIGALSNETARTINISLNFLDKRTKYEMIIFRDADNTHWETSPDTYSIDTKTVEASASHRIQMAAGGGQAILLKPIDK